MSRMVQLAARLYPRWWRERYGDEFAALLDDARPGMRGAFDVFKGALAMQLGTVSAKRILLFGGAVGLLTGLVAAYTLRSQYASVAVLGLPSGDTHQDVIDQVNDAQRQVLARGTLTRLIRQFNLYPGERKRHTPDDLLGLMRRGIRIETSGKTDFRIQFSNPDRVVAHQVAKALSTEFEKLNFPVLAPASVPTVPIFPNRRNISIVGLAFGLAFGGIAALAVHLSRRRNAAT